MTGIAAGTAAEIYAQGCALLVLALVAAGLLRLARLGPRPARVAGLAVAAVMTLPGLHAFGAGAVASLFAPFAPGAAVVAGLVLARPWLPPLRPPSRLESVAGGAGLAAFYAASLGATAIDPYALILETGPAIGLSSILLAAGVATGRPILALLGPLGLAAWLTGITGSENAADALLHPVMALALVPRVLAGKGRPSAAP
ncbi:hypothetical protein [Prosthecomicrobium sp. N25]|uniref:hypothetical protein n=1 Tax=Prosthecomicrobium sp. N25 TaxID=3129254 RepID=UPI00307711B1